MNPQSLRVVFALSLSVLASSLLSAGTITDWKIANFTPAQLMAGQWADDADPNGDGVTNLMAYAFGLTPNQSAVGALPQQSLSNGRLRLTYRILPAATDLLYQPLVSSNLLHWTTGTTEISRSNLPGGLQSVVVEDTGNGARRFIRLQISRTVFDSNSDGMQDDWQLRYFGSIAATGNGAPLANPSGDGFANIEKSVVGVSPSTAAAANSTTVLGLNVWTALR
jgi:hypothetical protein